MFLKNKNIIFKIRRSKVTDYAALSLKKKCELERVIHFTSVLIFHQIVKKIQLKLHSL